MQLYVVALRTARYKQMIAQYITLTLDVHRGVVAWESGQSEAAPDPISALVAIIALAAIVAIAAIVVIPAIVALTHGPAIGTSSPNRCCCPIVAIPAIVALAHGPAIGA